MRSGAIKRVTDDGNAMTTRCRDKTRKRIDAMALMDFVKRAMPADAYKPTATLGALRNGGALNANPAFAAASQREFGLDYYLRSALAGGICCGFTHGAVTPVDVVKVCARV